MSIEKLKAHKAIIEDYIRVIESEYKQRIDRLAAMLDKTNKELQDAEQIQITR